MDFEIARITTFRNCFPTAQIQGCFFHLVQNYKNKLVQKRLKKKYDTDATFALWVRMVPAVAFVPLDRVDEALMDLSQVLPNELQPLYENFEKYYVDRILAVQPNGRLVRATPMFPQTSWNLFERTLRGEGRTNNFAEAAHRRLKKEFNADHPSLWRFIDGLRAVQHQRDAVLKRSVTGSLPTPKKRRYLEIDKNLLHLVNTITTRTNVEFLRGIAQNCLLD